MYTMSNNETIEIFDILAISFWRDSGNVTSRLDTKTIEFLLASICVLLTVYYGEG